MNMKNGSKIASLGAIACSLALLGLGCDKAPSFLQQKQDKPTLTETVEAAKAVEFIPGDSFTIRQTFMGVGGFLGNLASFKDGEREVTITRFAPGHAANLDWSLKAVREKADSIKARNEYEAAMKDGKATGLPPRPEFEDIVTTGTVKNISLDASHGAFFPNYWSTEPLDLVGEKSGLCLSNDAFQELSRTRHTVLNFGVFDESAQKAAQGIDDVKDAYKALRQQADSEGAKRDLTLLEAEETTSDYTIRVNGEEKVVSVIKAKNWFGEIIVLNNAQNPLILKASLSPLKSGVADIASGTDAFLDKFFGYEITDITIKR